MSHRPRSTAERTDRDTFTLNDLPWHPLISIGIAPVDETGWPFPPAASISNVAAAELHIQFIVKFPMEFSADASGRRLSLRDTQ
jgi:hypothetical protein